MFRVLLLGFKKIPLTKLIYLVTISFTLGLCLFSCNVNKDLNGHYLLYKQSVQGNKAIPTSQFTGLYKQKTNKKLFGSLPMVSIYFFGKHRFDSTKVHKKITRTKEKFQQKKDKAGSNENKKASVEAKEEKKLTKLNKKLTEGNWIMKLGEAPTLYDSSILNQTIQLMTHHLVAEGYFYGTVTPVIDTTGKKVMVKYNIKEGPSFTYEEISQKNYDPKVDSILKSNSKDSKIKLGDRYRETLITEERTRIQRLMKENGYYAFSPSYIYFNVDTTKENQKIRFQTVILNPPGKEAHYVYFIDSVKFTTNINRLDSTTVYDSTIYNGVKYVSPHGLKFTKRIADRKIKIHPGDSYKESSSIKTQKNLSSLDIYKLVTINYHADTTSHRLKALINTTTFKRHQIVTELGLYVNQASAPGPFLNLSYRERNILHGFEIFDLTLRGSIAGQASILDPTNYLRTEEYSANATLSFPQLFVPGFRQSTWDNYNPRTRITTGYSIISRTEYSRATAKLGVYYNVNPTNQRQFIVSPADINIINTARISNDFYNYLNYLHQQGNNLIYGFRSSFVSDINASYIFNNNLPTVNTKSRFNKYYFESGGTFLNLLKTETIMGLQTFRYVKMNADLRYYYPVKKNTFAMRYNFGYAYPYGNNRGLPYEKYYFAGGPNSIRAWQLRRLGPGTYAPRDSSGQITYRIERPGELLLEMSWEYRFKIVSFFEGAAFVDAGNVWMLTKDPARPGSEFKVNTFFRQIAVGTGVGLRLNFTFFILRFDLGIKAYDPAVQQFVLFNSGLKGSIINFGIGYPF
jgi:outer membrane protein assembly factor BamA